MSATSFSIGFVTSHMDLPIILPIKILPLPYGGNYVSFKLNHVSPLVKRDD